MILQSLYEYYERKKADPTSGIAPLGFEWKEIPFIVVISREGKFVALEDTRHGEGKAKRAKSFLVPQGVKRSVGIKANLLWDNIEYALGANPRERTDIGARSEAFLAQIREELPTADPAVQALVQFLTHQPASAVAQGANPDTWQEVFESNANVTFRIDGSEYPTLMDQFHEPVADKRTPGVGRDICLVSGARGSIEPTHFSIKGVRGAQPQGAALVSFNADAYSSFGKEQNINAPVSTRSVFAYTTALNHLLRKDSPNKMQVGDASVVFWSDHSTSFESAFANFFTLPPKDDPDRDVLAVRQLYGSLDSGSVDTTSSTRFFVLGLAPNAARLSVRYWQVGSVQEMSHRLRQHFEDLEIAKGSKDVGRLSLFWLLVELANERKIDNIPPNVAGNLVRSILTGTPYPATVMQQAIRRIRAEQTVNRLRAGLLKACLNRAKRAYPTQEKEITVSLDPENTNVGYRLGRLFAVLEKIQEDASPGLNATIRDRYYGAASASPVSVFPQLLKLKNHHLKKLDKPAFVIAHERRLGEIFSGISPAMPAHLNMEDQARFAIGYYHQRQAIFTKGRSDDSTSVNEA